MRYEHYQYGRSHLWELVGQHGTFVSLRLWRFSGRRPSVVVRHDFAGAWLWLADRLPRRLVYFAAIRMAVHATSGPWSNEEVPKVAMMDAIHRWQEPRDDVEKAG